METGIPLVKVRTVVCAAYGEDFKFICFKVVALNVSADTLSA